MEYTKIGWICIARIEKGDRWVKVGGERYGCVCGVGVGVEGCQIPRVRAC